MQAQKRDAGTAFFHVNSVRCFRTEALKDIVMIAVAVVMIEEDQTTEAPTKDQKPPDNYNNNYYNNNNDSHFFILYTFSITLNNINLKFSTIQLIFSTHSDT